MWGLVLLALLVLHRAKLLASNQSILALGVAPRRVAGTPVPVFTPFPGERGQFGKDAEIRTHKALHDAKPSKCPKVDRDIKSALRYKISFCFNLNAVKQRMDILPHIAAFFKYRRQVYHYSQGEQFNEEHTDRTDSC